MTAVFADFRIELNGYSTIKKPSGVLAESVLQKSPLFIEVLQARFFKINQSREES
jgi:hypothetical protein